MWNSRLLYKVLAFAFCIVGGCGNDSELDMDNHAAIKMRDDGVYDVRYVSSQAYYEPGGIIGGVKDCLSINVNKEMSEKEMLIVLDYYELVHNASYGADGYEGERDEDYTCYAVFYEGDTDNEINRIKYYNNKKVEITDEDYVLFAPPYFRTEID